jgi:hypothetical protein
MVALGAGSFRGSGIGALASNPQNEARPGKGRQTLSLNGEWEIDDSISPEHIPDVFHHRVPVPGLAHTATPTFPDVDQFQSRENIPSLIRFGEAPESTLGLLGKDGVGISKQERNYFWYRKQFRITGRREVAILKVNKAQFGTAVWLNGKKIGEHLGCFTAAIFDVSEAIKWDGENQIVVRVGAHPGVLPKGALAGTDSEKRMWTPGIYDAVSLMLSDNPVIKTVQVAPRFNSSEILVQVEVKNYTHHSQTFDLSYRVTSWKGQKEVARADEPRQELKPSETKLLTQTIRIPGAKLWTPETPFLYMLNTSTGADSSETRFGMREFRFDTATKRAYLNGKVYFMRGSNITLHRFFEDPKSGSLPWDEKWLRKLLVEIPKQMNWNSFRFCIGPVPDQWLDIADEAGLLIQNEFFVWTGYGGRKWDVEETIGQYKEWMRDNWNHPSVAIWDANNETLDDIFADKIIPAVRSLDLSDRPWEDSYSGPAGPNDPVEDHPYLFSRTAHNPAKPFQMTELEGMSGLIDIAARPPHAHAMILNEYGYLWLNRDGSPTRLTKPVYDNLLGPDATDEERLALNGYLLGGLTEFWRAYRNYAGVLHFVYLTCSFPGAFTSDHFQDLVTLQLQPHFRDYVGEAFKPLGVYINFWQPTLEAGAKRRFAVMVINDEYQEATGRLTLSLETPEGKGAVRSELPLRLPALGQQTYKFDLDIPSSPADFILKAVADAKRKPGITPTISRRKVKVITRT